MSSRLDRTSESEAMLARERCCGQRYKLSAPETESLNNVVKRDCHERHDASSDSGAPPGKEIRHCETSDSVSWPQVHVSAGQKRQGAGKAGMGEGSATDAPAEGVLRKGQGKRGKENRKRSGTAPGVEGVL